MTEPEPSGWELMRAFNGLRTEVNSFAAGMVSQSMLATYQQAQKETDTRQDARIRQLELDLKEERLDRQREATEARKTKSQQNFAILLAGVGVLGSIIAGVIVPSINGGA